MHELALSITDKTAVLKEYTSLRPVGTVVAGVSAQRKREKWAEIVCDLASPKKRDRFNPRFLSNAVMSETQWKVITDIWTEKLQRDYFEADGLGIQDPNRIIAFTQLWNDFIVSPNSGWVDAIGKDERGVVDKVDTWLWSKLERKNFFVVVNSDLSSFELEEKLRPAETTEKDVRTIKRSRLDWESKIALSADSIAKIKDVSERVDPHFDKPVLKSLIEDASITAVK